MARYERITDHDWTPGDEYWKKTEVFWDSVRRIWSEILDEKQTLKLDQEKLKARSMFMTMFGMAKKFSGSTNNDQMNSEIEAALLNYLAIDQTQ